MIINKDQRAAFETVIAWLDGEMTVAPNRELADVSNYLQELLDAE